VTRVGALGLGDLMRAGGRAVQRYTGTVLALFVAQGVVAGVSIVAISQVLAAEFSHRPILDEAVDGDLIALLEITRDAPYVVWTSLWIVVGIALLWMVASWFLIGGTLAVLAERPEGRAATARCFGAGGANTFLSFLLLQVFSLVLYVPALFVLAFGMSWASAQMDVALTLGQLLGDLALGLAPGLSCLVVVGTIVDYARAELAVRKSSHELGALVALLRSIAFVLTHPRAIVHSLIGWAIVLALGVGYVWLSHGRAMLGGGGALTILVIRQCLSLLRMAVEVGVLAGQVELGQTRLPPPRPSTADDTEAAARRR
jgi:hypothetical protein